MRCSDVGAAIEADVGKAQIIHEEHDDVGTLVSAAECGLQQADDECEWYEHSHGFVPAGVRLLKTASGIVCGRTRMISAAADFVNRHSP
ncbi:MAG: hypothetical protein ACKPJD_36185, partial [Planctomycetaceae bacterium]